ncbi:hypothetical protein ACFVT9_29935 [Kitasatospora cineracea]|uniref:Uncharacterized protein n=2 Tax=Kitasatospora cineracea TaxID=88074 RepID=A0A8G1XB15_9ACTN|nr:hypothetical protein [Kitasatospora cineracea]ROR42498.1 hypothetical protein EDD39_0620 [Kitasatospora cineracea]
MPNRQPPEPTAKLTIRVYTVRADGARVQVSSCTSDEDCFPPLVSALIWPACRCPRCGGRDAVREPDAA